MISIYRKAGSKYASTTSVLKDSFKAWKLVSTIVVYYYSF
jgi:hypothetical protein